jgi:hypothetical protein
MPLVKLGGLLTPWKAGSPTFIIVSKPHKIDIIASTMVTICDGFRVSMG